jgi:hypothetical protein
MQIFNEYYTTCEAVYNLVVRGQNATGVYPVIQDIYKDARIEQHL